MGITCVESEGEAPYRREFQSEKLLAVGLQGVQTSPGSGQGRQARPLGPRRSEGPRFCRRAGMARPAARRERSAWCGEFGRNGWLRGHAARVVPHIIRRLETRMVRVRSSVQPSLCPSAGRDSDNVPGRSARDTATATPPLSRKAGQEHLRFESSLDCPSLRRVTSQPGARQAGSRFRQLLDSGAEPADFPKRRIRPRVGSLRSDRQRGLSNSGTQAPCRTCR